MGKHHHETDENSRAAHGALLCVSFTGPDDLVDPKKLHTFQQAFPFVEWSVLVCPSMTGQPHYPKRRWIHNFIEQVPGRKCLHICESNIHDFIDGEKSITDLAQSFNRVQLNFWQRRDPVDARAVDAAARAFGKPVIVPYNPGNKDVVDQMTAPNIQYLYDLSGGTGKEAEKWPDLAVGRKCGQAGGLHAGNITRHWPALVASAKGQPFWLCLENGLRDKVSGEFSFDRAKDMATKVADLAGLKVRRDFLHNL